MVEAKHRGKTLKLTKKDRNEIWATWHTELDESNQVEDLNQVQAQKLAKNHTEWKEHFLKKCIRKHLGHVPKLQKCMRYLHLQGEIINETQVWWVFWRKSCIGIYTDPKSRIQDRRYYLSWSAKYLGK